MAVDVGSGLGHLGRALDASGFKVIGLERDRGHSDNAKRRAEGQASSTGYASLVYQSHLKMLQYSTEKTLILADVTHKIERQYWAFDPCRLNY